MEIVLQSRPFGTLMATFAALLQSANESISGRYSGL